MAQQTAVDWLVNKIYMVIPNEERNFLKGLEEQAKQLEKKQIEDAWEDGKGAFSTRQSEEYYNEQYKK